MPHPAWFQEVMRDAAHTAFTSAFWDTIEQERDDLGEDDEDTLPSYGPGTELCGYTDQIPVEDRDKIANCFDRHLHHYHGVSFWELCQCVFDVVERVPAGDVEQRGSLLYRVHDAVGSEFLRMLGHGVSFWDDEMDAQEKAEERFPGLDKHPIYRPFDDVEYPEALLADMVDKHRAAISQTLPWGDSLRPPPPPPHS